jgi:hypothetical protein
MESKSADELPITNRFGLDFCRTVYKLERYSLNFIYGKFFCDLILIILHEVNQLIKIR